MWMTGFRQPVTRDHCRKASHANFSLIVVLQITNFGCLLVALWGMIGIWTTKVGYHNLWEFWFFNAQFGFTMGAQFSYGQAFMAELVPRGREYMFFSLLGIVSKGSSWIGPIVCSAIVDANGNQVRSPLTLSSIPISYLTLCHSRFYPP